MREQHFLHLARIDVRSAADDDVLRAVAQRHVAARVARAQVAGMQPSVAERFARGCRIVPVTGHYDIASAHDFAYLADRQRRTARIDDRDINAGARPSDRPENRVVRGRVIGAAQARDRHWRFALAVDLHEHRPEYGERLLQFLDVHRSAAVDDRAQVRKRRSRPLGLDAQALHHRRREERGACGMAIAQIEKFARLESGRRRNHVPRRPGDVGQDVQAGAVRHRRGVQQARMLVDGVDVGEVGDRHREQVPVRKHGAFRSAGRSAGVEKPRERIWRDWHRPLQRRRAQAVRVFAPADRRHPQCRARRAQRIRDTGFERRRCKNGRGACVIHDLRDLASVKLGVDRHGDHAGCPDAEQQLDVFGAVFAHDHHPVAFAMPLAQARAKMKCARRELGIIERNVGADANGGLPRKAQGSLLEQNKQVHGTKNDSSPKRIAYARASAARQSIRSRASRVRREGRHAVNCEGPQPAPRRRSASCARPSNPCPTVTPSSAIR